MSAVDIVLYFFFNVSKTNQLKNSKNTLQAFPKSQRKKNDGREPQILSFQYKNYNKQNIDLKNYRALC